MKTEDQLSSLVNDNPRDFESRIIKYLVAKQPPGEVIVQETEKSVILSPKRYVWEFDDLVIDRDVIAHFDGSQRPHPYNLLIVNGTLEFKENGRIVTRQNLAIRAREIRSEIKNSRSVMGRIDLVAAQDGRNAEPLPAPIAQAGPDGLKHGRDGGNGPDAGVFGEAGDGENGGKGDDGGQGSHGDDGNDAGHATNSTDLSIVTDAFDREAWVVVRALGGRGGNGSDGQSGGRGGSGKRGGHGGKGGKASFLHTAGRGGNAGRGGSAARGGDAGHGGAAGDGGDGGRVTTHYLQRFRLPKLFEVFNKGGAPGTPGSPGRSGEPGARGEPGDPGDGGDASSGRSAGNAGSIGIPGRPATPGAAAQNGREGRPGRSTRPVGPSYSEDPPIWPYAQMLSEEDWKEILNV